MRDKYKEYKEGFRKLYGTIVENVSTIENFMEQCRNLENIISSLDSREEDSKTKESLEILKNELSKSTENLVTQTKILLETYNNLIEEVFGK